ncbi:exo-beta-N-acetylmuramidase NamZ domain-containing protein [Fidelibacter multiformis]|uniref:exo-beta-N-acetylmuramidase NamZ family protein n=1 Tax=Fidelibacter multiformis TaxID=3377529 RepID=UPI0037DD8358
MKRTVVFIFFPLILAGFLRCTSDKAGQTQTGLDILSKEGCTLLKGKNVGIVTNHTAYNRQGNHISDIIHGMEDVTLTAIFAPEHGFRGTAEAGEYITEGIDSKTGARIYSIYGSTRKPTPEMLQDVDVLVFDIQDVGARFYTYISTMGNVMEAGAENGIPVLILDRPNPLGGWVEGPLLDLQWKSFVGMYPIPIRHGLTVGELAQMIKGEGWILEADALDLKVITMKNWHPKMFWEETGLTWIDPSPNIGGMNPATLYPGLCLLEATNVSEGRGTDHAFEWIGADFIQGEELAEALRALNIEGLTIEPVSFTPVDLPGKATNPKFENVEIEGISLQVTDPEIFESVTFGVTLLNTLNKLYPDDFEISRPEWANRLWGEESLNQAMTGDLSMENLMMAVRQDVEDFLPLKEKYSLYR